MTKWYVYEKKMFTNLLRVSNLVWICFNFSFRTVGHFIICLNLQNVQKKKTFQSSKIMVPDLCETFSEYPYCIVRRELVSRLCYTNKNKNLTPDDSHYWNEIIIRYYRYATRGKSLRTKWHGPQSVKNHISFNSKKNILSF